jgi:protein TonB
MIALSFMIGSRIAWWGSSPTRYRTVLPSDNSARAATPQTASGKQPGGGSPSNTKAAASANIGGLVVYDQGKVVFRMNPASPKTPAGPTALADAAGSETARVWLAPDLAESHLRQRSEPQYPTDALAAHSTGDVVLEVLVGADGSVASTRPMSGDPLLAAAAADAVRKWRYEPYRVQGRPAEFQTEVTLKFSLPD